MTSPISADVIEGQFLEHEHRRVREGLANLQDALDQAHRLSQSEVLDRVTRTLIWLRRDLLPHAAWEEAWLYPHLDEEAGTPWATRALRFDHEQIREVAAALETEFQAAHHRWNAELACRLTVALSRLEALVVSHIAQEERILLPLLDGDRDALASQRGAPHSTTKASIGGQP
jgi:iron-sulfur cluster repair protein YtfE (RIC family)